MGVNDTVSDSKMAIFLYSTNTSAYVKFVPPTKRVSKIVESGKSKRSSVDAL